MKLYSQNENYKLYHGNMLDMLEVIKPESIDSIVTDPPYELNFMGKGWDNAGVSFQKETWEKCFKVLKSGGYLLAFGGSRTFHRIACAIEDAGFEIRDTIMWLYGSGFPKSMDISKQIDKRGEKPDGWIEFSKVYKDLIKNSQYNHNDIDKMLNIKASSCYWARQDYRGGLPPKQHWNKIKEILGIGNQFDYLYEEAEREVIGRKEKQMSGWNMDGTTKFVDREITLPSTDLAKKWSGWGTTLKPSYEPIIVARKPFKGSLVDNVIEHGVGGINIDECRVAFVGNENTLRPLGKSCYQKGNKIVNGGEITGNHELYSEIGGNADKGRFPANTILTYDETDFDEVCGGFPITKSAKNGIRQSDSENVNCYGKGIGIKAGMNNGEYGDSGSASRYFYCAKASKKDRDEGLDTFIEEKVNDGRQTPIDNAFQRGETLRKNTHPTVKPTELMQYLVRLVSPNGATILDPFNGSGSTGKAVMYENYERNKNYKYIGIELTEEYLPISKARIEYVCNLKPEINPQMSIFDLEESR